MYEGPTSQSHLEKTRAGRESVRVTSSDGDKRPGPQAEASAIGQSIIEGAASVGGQAHQMGDVWYQRDVAGSIANMSKEAMIAEAMAKVAKQRRFMDQMKAREAYMSDVIGMVSPEKLRERAAGQRTYGRSAERAFAASRAAGGDTLATARAIRRGAGGARSAALRRAGDLQSLEVAQRGERWMRQQRDFDAREREADLIMSGFRAMQGTAARETAARAALNNDWRKILMGWTVPG